MALTPVAYTKNWKDTAGSQAAALDTAAKINMPTATSTARPEPDARITVGGGHPMKIDWGDGTVEDTSGGVLNHTYARNGAYRVRVWYVDYPDMFVDNLIRISSIAPNKLTPAFAVTMTELVAAVTATGVVLPVDVDFGDGTTERKWANNFNHTYAAAGTYTVSIRDVTGWRASAQAVATDAAPPPAPSAAPSPWEGMTRHDQLNEYIDQVNITPTDEWTTMTIADKKAWLTENYAK